MFTFIKRLQELLSKLKKNKGLWFTTLTTVSIIGIFVCMYVITTMTDSVSKEVYKSMTKNYETLLNIRIENKQKEFQRLMVSLNQNGTLMAGIEQNNKIMFESVSNFLNEEFLKLGFSDLKLNVYNVTNKDKVLRNTINTVINTKKPLFGTEVLEDGVFYLYLLPLLKDNEVYGVLEFKESIHRLRDDFEKQDSEFVFILDKKMLPFIGLEYKNNKYEEINEQFTLVKDRYDTIFAATVKNISSDEFHDFITKKYIIDEDYFRMLKKVTDINGAEIGYIIVGESNVSDGGFVNIASDMTNTVTTVALGLVISIILFLF